MPDNNQAQQLQNEMDDDPALINLVYLDTISRRTGSLLKSQESMQKSIDERLSKLLETQLKNQDTQLKSQEILNSILKLQDNQSKLLQESQLTQQLTQKTQLSIQEIQLSIQQILSKSLELQSSILQKQDLILEQQSLSTKELQADADKGRRIVISGSVTTTEFTIINTINDPGHPIKAYRIKNDGPNPIYVGYNNAISSVGPDITDVVNDPDLTGFEKIIKNESANESFNRNVIHNIYILASGGNSAFRAKLIW